jgi:hypothetical protein
MSMLFKAKKYIASKFSETQTGRSLVLRLFGAPGVAVLNGMYKSSER